MCARIGTHKKRLKGSKKKKNVENVTSVSLARIIGIKQKAFLKGLAGPTAALTPPPVPHGSTSLAQQPAHNLCALDQRLLRSIPHLVVRHNAQLVRAVRAQLYIGHLLHERCKGLRGGGVGGH